jgi:lysophospholipase L1-like esterase
MNEMRRLSIPVLSAIVCLGFCLGCSLSPSGPATRSTIVALGDSITMGIQDAGLVETNQLCSYPYLIAMQMGQARGFWQPLVIAPGIGVPPYAEPLHMEDGLIKETMIPTAPEGYADWMLANTPGKLKYLLYPYPYNNLGVNGARMDDLRVAKTYSDLENQNFFYDIVLRNLQDPYPNIGGDTTAIEQAVELEPDYILLWIGNNDILGFVMSGGEEFDRITDTDTFKTELELIVGELQTGAPDAKIILANIPEYLPFGYALDSVFVDDIPRLFDPQNLEPINFATSGPPDYKQLYIEPEDATGGDDGQVTHLLLTAAAAYISSGMGIDPNDLTEDDKTLLGSKGVTLPDELVQLVPITRDMVLTDFETQTALNTIAAFNDKIDEVVTNSAFPLLLVDMNSWMKPGAIESPLPDEECLDFVLVAQDNTIFSLDGVHPSNYGHAFIANEFIKAMKAEFGLGIPLLNTDAYAGQYSGKSLIVPSMKAVLRLGEMYAPTK